MGVILKRTSLLGIRRIGSQPALDSQLIDEKTLALEATLEVRQLLHEKGSHGVALCLKNSADPPLPYLELNANGPEFMGTKLDYRSARSRVE